MRQITINVPTMANWRTTVFGLVTAGGGAAFEYFQGGGLSWEGCAVAAAWAVLCYIVPDAKEGTTKSQVAGMIEAVVAARLAQTPEAPAHDTVKEQ